MMPIVKRLEDRISSEPSETAKAELSAELVCYLARQGKQAESSECLRELRLKFGRGKSPRVSVWIMIAEGVSGYFHDLNDAARDRLVRAFEVSKVAGYTDLMRLSASWLAHIDFNRGEYDSMASYLLAAEPGGTSYRDSADCRATVVLGDACLYAGLYPQAANFHEMARRIAVELGDETTLAALMYNRAALNCLRAQTSAATGEVDEEPKRHLGLQVDSSEYFHRAAHHTSLAQLSQSLRARQKMASGCFEAAIPLYKAVIDSDLPVSFTDDAAVLRSELALCLARTGDLSAATDLVRDLIGQPGRVANLSVDARLIFWFSADEVALASGADDLLAVSGAARSAAVAEFKQEQATLRAALLRVQQP